MLVPPAATVDFEVERRKLRSALAMTWKSVPSLIVGTFALAWLGHSAGREIATILIVVAGLSSAVWRVVLWQRYGGDKADTPARVDWGNASSRALHWPPACSGASAAWACIRSPGRARAWSCC